VLHQTSITAIRVAGDRGFVLYRQPCAPAGFFPKGTRTRTLLLAAIKNRPCRVDHAASGEPGR
jgi:hypothetical protein